MKPQQHGFTLVELSIVLVIIGLIVGGIVGGQSLIRQSRITSIFTDVQKYQTAIRAFDLQYDAMPGDFVEATDYWPSAAGNGNGNGSVQWGDSEIFYVWNHLGLAKVIPSEFTGTHTNFAGVMGVNIPAVKVKNAGIYLQHTEFNSFCSGTNRYTGGDSLQGKKTLIVGIKSTVGPPWNSVLTPAEAKTLDKKYDDGRPAKGKIRGYCANTCATTNNVETAEYKVSNATKACAMVFYE